MQIKMSIVIVLSVAAVQAVGGIDSMKAKLAGHRSRQGSGKRPNLADPETGYVRVMIDYLQHWMRGLMVAAFCGLARPTSTTWPRRSGPPCCWPSSRRSSHVLHGHHRRRLKAADNHWRGHGDGAHSALVLVAHQRLERNIVDGDGVPGLDPAADAVRAETFWKPIARLAPDVPPSRDGARNLLD